MNQRRGYNPLSTAGRTSIIFKGLLRLYAAGLWVMIDDYHRIRAIEAQSKLSFKAMEPAFVAHAPGIQTADVEGTSQTAVRH